MVVNGISFSDEYARSVTEEAFVKTFEAASWNSGGKQNELIREVYRRITGSGAKAGAEAKAEAKVEKPEKKK